MSGMLDGLFKLLTGLLLLAFAGLGVLILANGDLGVPEFGERGEQKAVAAAVRPLIEPCQAAPATAPVPIRGKVLVWDMRNNRRSDAHDRLPADLRAASTDGEITVFMIVGEHAVPRADARTQKCNGCFTQYVDVCVAYWPQKVAAGAVAVPGRELRFG